MPFQLIFTSAPQGLIAGRSGFCTVARHRAMPDRLAQLLEAIGTPHGEPQGETFTFRTLEASDKTWFVLSRFVARGLDYTQRDNRLAHHLVFSTEEAAVLPPPAALAQRWKGWLDTWSDQPTWLEGETKALTLSPATPLIPAITWREIAGTGSKAAWLVQASGAQNITFTNAPDTQRVLRLFAEASALLGKAAWFATFTTNAQVTGSNHFAWCVGNASSHTAINLAEAAALPAPSGDFARQAAMGVTQGNAKNNSYKTTAENPAAEKNSSGSGLLIPLLISGGFVILASFLGWRYYHQPDSPAPTPVVVTKKVEPPPIDTAKADEIMRATRVLSDLSSYVGRDDYVTAAKLWMKLCEISPDFSRKYSEQHLPKIQSNYAATTARLLLARLETPGAARNFKTTQEINQDAIEALTIGEKFGIPKNEDWQKLVTVATRAQLLTTLDIRSTIVLGGEWVTADLGSALPSSAEFKLSPAATAEINKFIEASGATTAKSVNINLRLLELNAFHQRDTSTPTLRGEIRRGAQSNWIESTPEPGRQPAVSLSIGNRYSSVALNFKDGSAAKIKGSNRLLEIELPSQERIAFALISDFTKIKPLNLTIGGLQCETSTGVVHAAAWAEPIVNSFIIVGGMPGLYPDGHEFPDRDLPSIRATRSVLDTDIIRMERKSGPNTPSNAQINARRQAFLNGNPVQAGAPWSLLSVDPKGQVIFCLLEFR